MPIVVEHQPSFVGVGQTAFRAGYGQFQQQQFQNSMAVMQMALQERARQQALAAQQQAQYLGAQQEAADRQSRERMFMLQQSNQAAMNDADNRSRMQMELWQGQQQAQNYADLRDHQTQLAQFKAASSSAEYDKKARMEMLGKMTSGSNTVGQQLASKMRAELGIITSARAAGTMDDQQYQSALAAWDEKFGAEGDWSQYKVDPAAQAKSTLEASKVQDPKYGWGTIIQTPIGPRFMPDEPTPPQLFGGVPHVGYPDPKVGIDWRPVEQPKQEKPKAPTKPPFTPAEVQKKAEELAEMYPGFSPQQFIDSGAVTDELNKLLIPGISAPAGGEGEAVEPEQSTSPPQAQPGQQPQAGAPQQTPQPQAMEANEPPPSVQGEQERAYWQQMTALSKSSPKFTQDSQEIQLLLSQGMKITDPQLSSKIELLYDKVEQDAKQKAIPIGGAPANATDATEQTQEPQQSSVGFSGALTEFGKLGSAIPVSDLMPFFLSLGDASPVYNAVIAIRKNNDLSPPEKAVALKQLLDENMALYTSWKEKQAKP